MKDFSYFIRTYEDAAFTRELTFKVIEYGESVDFSFYVKIGKNEGGNEVLLDSTGFKITADEDIFSIRQDGNKIDVHVDNNESIEDLSNVINIVPLLFDYTQAYVYVIQKANIFSVSAEDNVTLPMFQPQTRNINISISGGTERFKIKTINKYLSDGTFTLYDNGLIYDIDNTKGSQKIIIKSNGVPFLENGAYYEIVVCHEEKLVLPLFIIDNDESSEFYGTYIEDPNFEEKEELLTHSIKVTYGGGGRSLPNRHNIQNTKPQSLNETQTLFFSSNGETKYFPLIGDTVEFYYNISDDIDWCHVNKRALNYSIMCDTNGTYEERECQCEILGEILNIHQNAKQVNITEHEVVFECDDNDVKKINLYGISTCNSIRNGNWYSVEKSVENGHVVLNVSCTNNTNEKQREKIVNIKQGNVVVSKLIIKQNGFSSDANTHEVYMKLYIDSIDESNLYADIREEDDNTVSKIYPKQLKFTKYAQQHKIIVKTKLFDINNNAYYNPSITIKTSGKWISNTLPKYNSESETIESVLELSSDNNFTLDRIGFLTITNNFNQNLTIALKVIQTNQSELTD